MTADRGAQHYEGAVSVGVPNDKVIVVSRAGTDAVAMLGKNVGASHRDGPRPWRGIRGVALRRFNPIRVCAPAYATAAVWLVRKRRRWSLPRTVSLGLAYSVPLAVAATVPRGRRGAALTWAAHMWAYKLVFEMPYDRPELLRPRLH